MLIQQCAPPLQISVVNAPPLLISVLLQGRGGPPPPPLDVRAYAPLISALRPKRFDTPLQPSNMPDPLTLLSSLPLHTLVLNPPPPPSVSFQGRGGPLLLPSVTHAHAPLFPALHLWQGMPTLLPSNVTTPLQNFLFNEAGLVFSL